nr:Toll/interleukin-1 receptor (TIR) domain-containing protein [Tanacetum cinerariifolium]
MNIFLKLRFMKTGLTIPDANPQANSPLSKTLRLEILHFIFSKNYASSSWCLEELVKIMECQKGFGHTAYLVFYDVEPTEVRKQSGSVGDAFAKRKENEAARKWREALKEASDLVGWELKSIANG